MSAPTLVVLTVGSTDDDTCVPAAEVLSALRLPTDAAAQTEQTIQDELEGLVHSGSVVAVLVNAVPQPLAATSGNTDSSNIRRLCQLAIRKCAEERKQNVHILKNFKGPNDALAPYLSRRARQVFRFHDLETTEPDQVALNIQNYQDTDDFSSPGESFAWQLVTGFLSYILPDLQLHIESHLLDDRGSFQANILQEFGMTDLDPQQILVLPKYFLLLSEQLAWSQQPVAMCPQQLFPGCKKISSASSDLCLEFDSPGYKKRIPAYLMELEKSITNDQSTYSHVVIFCGYAAPTFIIQKLDLSIDKKQQMFRQFVDELQFIVNHPKSSQLLRDFNEFSSADPRGDESSTVQLVTEFSSLRHSIVEEAKSHVLTQDWCLVPRSLHQTGEATSLILKFSISIESQVIDNVGQSLSAHGFSVEEFPRASAHQVGPCDRFLFVLQLEDLRKIREEQGRSEFDDTRQSHLMRDIESAVSSMHRCGRYNISVVIVCDTTQQDALSHLPDGLRHLPDRCVVTVSDLTHIDSLQFAVAGGSKRSGSFSDVISILDLHNEGITAEDSLPLMSMAYAMAANSWIGFAQLLLSHCLQATSEGQQLPFDPPYCFVIPKSGRYPDEAKLHRRFEEVGASSELEEFRVPSGRRYSFRVHRWESLRVAFEIPSSVLSIRKQAECGVGDIRSGQLSAHLTEFSDALQSFVKDSDRRIRVIDWDDVTGFDEDAWMEPSEELARSLLNCLAAELLLSR